MGGFTGGTDTVGGVTVTGGGVDGGVDGGSVGAGGTVVGGGVLPFETAARTRFTSDSTSFLDGRFEPLASRPIIASASAASASLPPSARKAETA